LSLEWWYCGGEHKKRDIKSLINLREQLRKKKTLMIQVFRPAIIIITDINPG